MKIKVSETTNPQLDWLVAKCSTLAREHHGFELRCTRAYWRLYSSWEPCYASTLWSQGGPILTRERISRTIDHSGLWIAYWTDGYGDEDYYKKWMQCDRSELVAGLRCFVTSKLGDEVEVPDELS